MIVSLRTPLGVPRHSIVAEAGLDQLTVYDRDQFIPSLIKFHPQLLHAHFATDATVSARAFAAELGVPFTFTAHGYDIYFQAPEDFHERAIAAAAMVTVSEANRRHFTNTFDVSPDHIHVIPNGVDTDFFQPAPDSGLQGQPPVIVCVARYVRVKNLPILLEACAMLRERGIEFRCVLIGDGASRSELETMRHLLALDRIVEMTGALERNEVLRWWQRASVAALSSDSEGIPVSLMEAAACGVPAVATLVGGIPEFVEDGDTGLLVPPRDAASMADALAQLLCDPRRAIGMGRAARRRVKNQFSLKPQVDQLLTVWQNVLQHPKVPPAEDIGEA